LLKLNQKYLETHLLIDFIVVNDIKSKENGIDDDYLVLRVDKQISKQILLNKLKLLYEMIYSCY
jgi:hypothetical protein